MKIAIFSTQPHEPGLFNELNQAYEHDLTYFDFHLNKGTIASVPETDAVCCFVNDAIDAAVIDGLIARGVKLLALRSAGFNHVDVAYAAKCGLPVCRVPAYSPNAVAEHAVAMILCLNRQIHRAHNRVKEGDFSLHGLMGFELSTSTIGIIGLGKIGRVFAQILQGFGCRIIAYDPQFDDSVTGVESVTLSSLYAQSDIISLHCPLTPKTKHLINEESLSAMKDGVMLVNTGRGQLIDTASVIQALKLGKLGYLALDVYEEEESLFFEDHSDEIIQDDLFCRLLTFPNVLITGHQAFFTKQAVTNIVTTTLENCSNFEKQQGIVHTIKA